jgi:hypothetical protein
MISWRFFLDIAVGLDISWSETGVLSRTSPTTQLGPSQNLSLEVSTPLIGPSNPSTIFPPPPPPPSSFDVDVDAEVGAAASLGLTPNEAHSNRYLALIFDTRAVKSISPASGEFVIGN